MALASFFSPRHAAIKSQFQAVDDALELKSRSFDIIGDWGDGAENSILTEYENVKDFSELEYVMAWKGKLADQKAVLAFMEQEDGPHSISKLELNDTIENVRKVLTQHGIAFRSLSSTDGGTQVSIVEFDDTLVVPIAKVSELYGIQPDTLRGSASFIGVDSDRPREEAVAEYDRIIAEYERNHSSRRRYLPQTKLAADVRGNKGRYFKHAVTIGIAKSRGKTNAS